MSNGIYRILLVDDDEDDYIIFRDLLLDIKEVRYQLDWASNYDAALEIIKKGNHDIFFFDYRLGKHNGLELLREVIGNGCKIPIILLTGLGDHEVDMEAMKSGASDFLVKNEVSPALLERSIRYTLKHKKLEDELYKEKERAIVTLESIGDSVITTDTNGRITYLNLIAEKTTGWSNSEAQGVPFGSFIKIINEITREPIRDPVEKVLRQNTIVSFSAQHFFVNREGRELAIEGTASPIRNRENQIVGIVIVFHDVTDTHEMSKKISYQATHDSLTGLANRSSFEEKLQMLINKAKSRNMEHALLYLDLEQFKMVNDICGHFAGNQLLRQISALMKQQIQQSDAIARLGGDEFGILLEECPVVKACETAEKICQAVSDFRFVWGEKSFSVKISIGVVRIDSKCEDIDWALRAAYQSCNAAKTRGGGKMYLYQEDDRVLTESQGEIQWITFINKVFEEKRFCLYYQPIVPIITADQCARARVQFEILIRVLDEKGNLLYPGTFLPAVQRYNMMPEIDHWVIETFFTFFSQTLAGIYQQKPFSCNINLSGVSLCNESFVEFIKKQFQQTKTPAEAICFEITETTAIANFNIALHFIQELKSLGCRFALDDFGNELASFNYLRHLPVDYVKIDGIFIKNMIANEIDSAMVESINQIAHIMKIQTIAEFVENEATYHKLRKMNTDYVQGFYLAKPAPIGEIIADNFYNL